jgi:hypothetical protein
MDTDGTWDMRDQDSLLLGSGSWVIPGSVAGEYEVKSDETANTFDTDPSNGSFVALTSARTWAVVKGGATGTKTVVFTLTLRHVATAEVVLVKTGITMVADFDSGA